jgi:hypothetical protein
MQGKMNGVFTCKNQLILSCWNKSDSLIASGGEDTHILVWKPNKFDQAPECVFEQPGQIIEIAWKNDR